MEAARGLPCAPSKSISPPGRKHYLVFDHHSAILAVFELYIDGIVSYVFFCVWFLLPNILCA